MQAYGLLLSMLLGLSVCLLDTTVSHAKTVKLGCVRLGSGSPERKGQCWGHVPLRY